MELDNELSKTSDLLKILAQRCADLSVELQQQQEQLARGKIALPEPPSKWDQLDPLRTERTKFMSWYFKTFGVLGLAYYIVEIAKFEASEEAQRNKHQDFSSPEIDQDHDDSGAEFDHSSQQRSIGQYDKSWDLIIDDDKHNYCRKIVYYLTSLPGELIEALIEGNLPYRMQDTSFKRRMDSYVKPVDRQGTYGIWVALNRVGAQSTQEDQAINSNAGKGLTLRQMMEVHETMSMYINTDHPDSAEIAQKIDTTFSGDEKSRHRRDYEFQRRYASGGAKDTFGHQKEWLDFIEAYYIQWASEQLGTADENLLDVHLHRCPVYVGLSRSVANRIPNHQNHTATTNPIMGLLTATLEHLYPGMFAISNSSYQIFRTTSKDDIGFDEKLSMILTGAYPWDGGLNAAYGGRSRGPKDNSAPNAKRMDYSKAELEASKIQTITINESLSKIRHIKRLFDAEQTAGPLRKKTEQNLRKSDQHLQDLKSRIERLQAVTNCALIDDLVTKLQAARDRR